MNLKQIFGYGNQAKHLLDNEAFKAAIVSVQSELIEEWKLSKSSDTQTRERLYLSVKLLADIEERLRILVSNMEFELAIQEQAKPE